jgi:hypothetical protein
MKYLPFEKYTISTSLSVEEAKRRLLDNLEPSRNLQYIGNATKPYSGRIGIEEFTISRVIRYRNSFLPDIKGRFVNEMGHTEIHIVMRPTIVVLAFMGVWMSGILIACVASLVSLLAPSGGPFSPMELIPFGMLLFGYLLCTLGFKVESAKSKQFLAELWRP